MMMTAFYNINRPSWVFIVLAAWNNSPWASHNLDTRFRTNQLCFLLLNILHKVKPIPDISVMFYLNIQTCSNAGPRRSNEWV